MVMKTLTMLVMVCLLGGCASSQKMTIQDRQRITVVAISSQVKKPDSMEYTGPGKQVNEDVNLLAAMLGHGGKGKPLGEDLQLQALSNNIYIDKIVRESVVSAFKTENKFGIVAEGTPDAYVMVIEVNAYGFEAPGMLSSEVVPRIKVTCSLSDPTGRIVWRASDQLLNIYNPVQAQRPENLYLHPELMEASWREASEIIATRIVKEF
jgi:hypothetical protein